MIPVRWRTRLLHFLIGWETPEPDNWVQRFPSVTITRANAILRDAYHPAIRHALATEGALIYNISKDLP